MHAFCESCVLFHMSYFKLHYAPLRTSHFSLRSSHSTLRTPHFTLHAPHFTLHSSHSTLTLHPSSHLSSSHLIPVISSYLISSHMSFKLPCHFPVLLQELACAVRRPDPCVRACEVAALLSKNMTCARPRCNATPSKHFLTLHIALFTPHTPHFTLAPHLNSSHLSLSHLISCLPICQLSSSWLFSCHLSAAQPFSSHRS